MTIHKDEPSGASYVLKVGEENRRHAQELLTENGRLRLCVVSLEGDRARLIAKTEMLDRIVEEHEAMRTLLSGLQQDKARLQEQLLKVREEQAGQEKDRGTLRRQLAEVEAQNQRFSEEYVEVERRNNNLMNLYVASYRLHGTLDRQEVLGTIQEIVSNLVGCEEQAIFEVDPAGAGLHLVASVGIDPAAYSSIALGQGVIGRTALAGETYIANGSRHEHQGPGESHLTASIPLKLNGRVTGAIALFRLLPHKPSLGEVDHELFELLATHAATALYCTKLHADVATETQAAS